MDNNPINPVSHARRRYFLEFTASMTAYAVAILVRHWLLHGHMKQDKASWQIVVALLPLIPAIFLFAAIVRLTQGTDELYRRIIVNSLALAGGATALIAVTYGLIEGDFVPHLSAWWTYATFMVAWIVATYFVRRQYR